MDFREHIVHVSEDRQQGINRMEHVAQSGQNRAKYREPYTETQRDACGTVCGVEHTLVDIDIDNLQTSRCVQLRVLT